jgi:hypothetical protein
MIPSPRTAVELRAEHHQVRQHLLSPRLAITGRRHPQTGHRSNRTTVQTAGRMSAVILPELPVSDHIHLIPAAPVAVLTQAPLDLVLTRTGQLWLDVHPAD